MHQLLKTCTFLFLATAATAITAQAADVDPAAGGLYGRAFIGVEGIFDDIDGQNSYIPFAYVGAKVASELGDSHWGWQGDLDVAYNDVAWVVPSVDTTLDMDASIANAMFHFTYSDNPDSKFGVFMGYKNTMLSLTEPPNSLDLTTRSTIVGVEGMMQISDQTSISGRLALVDPFYASATVSDGVTTATADETDFLGDSIGGLIGFGVKHDATEHLRLSFDATAQSVKEADSSKSTKYGVYLSAGYDVGDTPIDITARVGMIGTDDDTSKWQHDPYAALQLNYNFGEQSRSASRELF